MAVADIHLLLIGIHFALAMLVRWSQRPKRGNITTKYKTNQYWYRLSAKLLFSTSVSANNFRIGESLE